MFRQIRISRAKVEWIVAPLRVIYPYHSHNNTSDDVKSLPAGEEGDMEIFQA